MTYKTGRGVLRLRGAGADSGGDPYQSVEWQVNLASGENHLPNLSEARGLLNRTALVFSTPAILGAVDLVLGLVGPLLLTGYVYRRSVWLRR